MSNALHPSSHGAHNDAEVTGRRSKGVDLGHDAFSGCHLETQRARLQAQKDEVRQRTHEHWNHGGRKRKPCPHRRIRTPTRGLLANDHINCAHDAVIEGDGNRTRSRA